MVPSLNWKVLSGWTNDSCKVTSHEMMETEMGNRGAKSVDRYLTVKVQRVDGSCGIEKSIPLRCTLSGFERNYQTKIHSKQIKFIIFSSLLNGLTLDL